MSRSRAQGLTLIAMAAALATATDAAAASSPSATVAATHGTATASHKGKPKKPVGPSMSVVGFGINRLFVPHGETVKSDSQCDEMVGSDTPIGPPQQVYLTVFLRATAIPPKAPTQIADSLPSDDGELSSPELTPPVPWSKAFAKGSFAFGEPTTGDQKDLFHTFIVSFSAEEGTYEGPSAEEFDGTYSYTTSVKAGGHTLTSTAKVTVECPYLR